MKIEDLERALQDAKYHHVKDDVLVSYRDQQLDAISRTQIEAHLNLCLICERRLLRLREEHAEVERYEPGREDRALVKQVLQRVRREQPQVLETGKAAARTSVLERFAEQMRQAAASWRAFAMQLAPVRGATRGTETWRWQSEDGQLTLYMVVEPTADLTLHASARNPELEGARLKIKVGSLSREAPLQRVSESESHAEVVIPRKQRPKHLRDISIEVD
jgi:hypothetical protein